MLFSFSVPLADLSPNPATQSTQYISKYMPCRRINLHVVELGSDDRAEWTVRAVTRDVSKESAKKLAEQGAEVISGNLDDKASLVEAMRGSYAAFGVTNYWEYCNADKEIQQGKNLADAAKEAGVQHYIWSSLLDINKLSHGKLPNAYHFDSKAAVEEYTRTLGIPATFFLPGFYMSNIGSVGGLLKPSSSLDNTWTFALLVSPTAAVIPMYHVGDTGKYVKAIALNRDKLLGKRFLAATAYMTAQEVLDAFKELFPVAGRTARYFELPEDMFRAYLKAQGSPDFVVSELYENMRLLEEFGYYGGASLDETHALVEDELTTFAEYAKTCAEGFKGLE
ncbi:NmrA-like family-domain-containing protein [Bombardia bombarda]|uniref:NmrA-like family-domain-containing protein n=1 Tax=Bombardia bombarda TaxID=252184 RepID=A0AA40CE43_9PEZI|nr:NmrA-like family-domain-containing protein [Bombardia bombarda]